MDKEWVLYIVECRTKELYVGITNDIARRLKLHNTGRACRYTKFRRPVQLKYVEPCGDYGAARRREIEVKRYSKAKKLTLMA